MKPAFSVKSAHLDALSIQLQDCNLDTIRETLQDQINKYLKFKALPFILDARMIEDGETVPFTEILALFALHELKIIGLRHISNDWQKYAEQHNLVFLSAEKSDKNTKTTDDSPTEHTPIAPSIILNTVKTVPEPAVSEAAETADVAVINSEPEMVVEVEEIEEIQGTETSETPPEEEADTLSNDNDAIKTVEMAKMADLVELSPEEARRLHETDASELSGQVGEAKGEIVSISEAKRTIVVSTPVRTGQQIYAEKADLIVLGIVSPGAEVIADGNIHIYAPLRGRALAGASGDKKARIFVQSMQGELVSIAGVYRTFEQKLPPHLHKQPVQIELQDDRLAISSIVAE